MTWLSALNDVASVFQTHYLFWSLPKCTSATTYASTLGIATIFKTVTFSSRRLSQIKWNESGFRPPLCTYRLNWARRTSWGWWDDWDDTVLQTQDSKFEPWGSEAEHATSRSRRLPTILSFTRGWGRNIFCLFQTAETGDRTPNPGMKGSGANHYPTFNAMLYVCHNNHDNSFLLINSNILVRDFYCVTINR